VKIFLGIHALKEESFASGLIMDFGGYLATKAKVGFRAASDKAQFLRELFRIWFPR
jgi:hypothetical protein